MPHLARLVLALFLIAIAPSGRDAAQAADAPMARGTVSGLPLPRYVSLKSDRVNLREGPSKDHRVTWVFTRAGLPVEIIAEFETWRRIRDSEGSDGWVLHSLLSGRRTALVSPWSKGQIFTMRERASEEAAVVARLEAGVVVDVRRCTGSWCEVAVSSRRGFMEQDKLWGVYPNERIE